MYIVLRSQILIKRKLNLLTSFLNHLKFICFFKFVHELINTLFEPMVGRHMAQDTPITVTVSCAHWHFLDCIINTETM